MQVLPTGGALTLSLYHRHVRDHVVSYKHHDTYSAAVPASLIFTSDCPRHVFSQYIFIIMNFKLSVDFHWLSFVL